MVTKSPSAADGFAELRVWRELRPKRPARCMDFFNGQRGRRKFTLSDPEDLSRKKRSQRRWKEQETRDMVKGLIVGILVGILMVACGGYFYFSTGRAPVAVTDPPMPFEKKFAKMALNAHIAKVKIPESAVTADEKR